MTIVRKMYTSVLKCACLACQHNNLRQRECLKTRGESLNK